MREAAARWIDWQPIADGYARLLRACIEDGAAALPEKHGLRSA
jgi:hypothetical protein